MEINSEMMEITTNSSINVKALSLNRDGMIHFAVLMIVSLVNLLMQEINSHLSDLIDVQLNRPIPPEFAIAITADDLDPLSKLRLVGMHEGDQIRRKGIVDTKNCIDLWVGLQIRNRVLGGIADNRFSVSC